MVLATGMVVIAHGYRINTAARTLESTGAIQLKGTLSHIAVVHGTDLVGDHTPLFLPNLKPDQTYSITITKDGYVAWHKDIRILSEQVASIGPIVMFQTKYQATATDAPDVATLCQKNQPSADAQLYRNGSELRQSGTLIVRLSEDIRDSCWFNDHYHVAYITEKSVRVVEKDGSNETTIFTSLDPLVHVAVARDNKTIYFSTTNNKEMWFAITITAE